MIISPLLNLGTDPPTRPVLPPCGTIGIFFLKQNLTIFWIEVNDFGKKIIFYYIILFPLISTQWLFTILLSKLYSVFLSVFRRELYLLVI